MRIVNSKSSYLKSNGVNIRTLLKTIRNLLIAFIFVFPPFSNTLFACTSFVLKGDEKILLAKNLDWPIGDGFIFINRRGEIKSTMGNSDDLFSWKSRYGSITFNQFGKNLPLGGINESGLVLEELSYSLSEYPEIKEYTLNEFEWVQFQLDNFQNVEEVIENLDAISIEPLVAKLHYIVCDRSGQIAIIEFINGKAIHYTGESIPIPVLTNNSYKNLLNYSTHYKGFGGDKIVTNGSESPERFIRAATMLKESQHIDSGITQGMAFNILKAVEQNDTQWSIVYDVCLKELLFKTKKISAVQKIRLSDFDYCSLTKISNLSKPAMNKGQPVFHNYSRYEDRILVRIVLRKLIDLHELSTSKANRINYLLGN